MRQQGVGMTREPNARFGEHHMQEIIQQNRHPDTQWIFTKRLLGQVGVLECFVHIIDLEQEQISTGYKEYKCAGCKQTERKN